MYLRDLVVGADSKYARWVEFGFTVKYIESLYLSCLPKKVETSKFGKIIIEAVEEHGIERPIQDMINVVKIRKLFDFDAYWKLEKQGRKQRALDFIQLCILELAEKYDWDMQPFKEAYTGVLEKDFVHRSYWKKPITSPNKKLNAQLFIDFNEEGVKVEMVVRKKSGEELRRWFVTLLNKPSLFFVDDTFGSIEWLNDEKLVMLSRDKQKNWTFNCAD